MKKHFTLLTALFILAAPSIKAQDLEIQNLSSNWGFDYDESTGFISNLFFKPAEGDGVDIDDEFVISWGVRSDVNDPSTYTEIDRQTVTQGIAAFNAITADNWPDKNLNDFDLPAGEYLVVAVVDSDEEISETDEENNALFLATSADDTFTFDPSGGTSVTEIDSEFSIDVFPVPAADKIRFEIPVKNGKFEILNAGGKLIKQGKLNNQEETQQLSIADLSEGIYFLKVKSEDREMISRFVKN